VAAQRARGGTGDDVLLTDAGAIGRTIASKNRERASGLDARSVERRRVALRAEDARGTTNPEPCVADSASRAV
jgi:hypothetical protein